MEKLSKINQEVYMHKITAESVRLGVILAMIGGFLDAYTFIEYNGVFANAQTGNIVLVGIGIAKANLNFTINALLPILSCIAGVFVCLIVKEKVSSNFKWEKKVIILEAATLLLVYFFHDYFSSRITTTIISFVSSIQIASFRRLVDSPYCTTMCTGNLRQACERIFSSIVNKDKEDKKRAIRLCTVILFFVIGAFLGGVFCNLLGRNSIIIEVLFLVLAYCIFVFDEFRFEKRKLGEGRN